MKPNASAPPSLPQSEGIILGTNTIVIDGLTLHASADVAGETPLREFGPHVPLDAYLTAREEAFNVSWSALCVREALAWRVSVSTIFHRVGACDMLLCASDIVPFGSYEQTLGTDAHARAWRVLTHTLAIQRDTCAVMRAAQAEKLLELGYFLTPEQVAAQESANQSDPFPPVTPVFVGHADEEASAREEVVEEDGG